MRGRFGSGAVHPSRGTSAITASGADVFAQRVSIVEPAFVGVRVSMTASMRMPAGSRHGGNHRHEGRSSTTIARCRTRMTLAQKLYEAGRITCMRSDAVLVASEAQAAARVWLMPRGRGGGCARRRTPIPVARPGCRRSERLYGERWRGQGSAGTRRGNRLVLLPAGLPRGGRPVRGGRSAGRYPRPASVAAAFGPGAGRGRARRRNCGRLPKPAPAPAGSIIFRREAELHVGSDPSPATTRVSNGRVVTCAATDPDATGD